MAKFKLIISDPKTGKSTVQELEDKRASVLVGRKIGEDIDGSLLGLPAQRILITGGSDKDGFPMRSDVQGGVKTQVLLTKSLGFRGRFEGERQRKTIRGNVITDDAVQINAKIVYPAEPALTQAST
jgi:small subunit ribosomal protein S6e